MADTITEHDDADLLPADQEPRSAMRRLLRPSQRVEQLEPLDVHLATMRYYMGLAHAELRAKQPIWSNVTDYLDRANKAAEAAAPFRHKRAGTESAASKGNDVGLPRDLNRLNNEQIDKLLLRLNERLSEGTAGQASGREAQAKGRTN